MIVVILLNLLEEYFPQKTRTAKNEFSQQNVSKKVRNDVWLFAIIVFLVLLITAISYQKHDHADKLDYVIDMMFTLLVVFVQVKKDIHSKEVIASP
jgi:hypothetical protein